MALIALVVLVGAVIIERGLPWAKEYLEQSAPDAAVHILKAWFVFIFLSMISMALHILSFGRRVLKHERIPPPGARVIMDTKLIVGDQTRPRGHALVGLSLLLIVVGLYGPCVLPICWTRL